MTAPDKGTTWLPVPWILPGSLWSQRASERWDPDLRLSPGRSSEGWAEPQQPSASWACWFVAEVAAAAVAGSGQEGWHDQQRDLLIGIVPPPANCKKNMLMIIKAFSKLIMAKGVVCIRLVDRITRRCPGFKPCIRSLASQFKLKSLKLWFCSTHAQI